ncbi:ATP-binding protein [Coraliomargarita algicola]|uniref:histidine kinase n=1 Tax=Coraliomargarita algicola TaxID=3092156 RepID=A0ABZ0RHE9_9BACT|nr:ATP-binding protein [Coraliomargarita sp. J2-16]WPJ94523.1 ATP-binding protein [Coraliomargarita sp. J2-16]
MILHSIRSRIQVWHTLLLSLLMLGLLTAFYVHEKEIFVREFDANLMQSITSLMPRYGTGGPGSSIRRGPPPGENGRDSYGPGPHGYAPSDDDPEALWAWRDRASEGIIAQGWYVVSMSRDGSIVYKTPNAPESVEYPEPTTRTRMLNSAIRVVGTNRECVHYGPRRDVVILGASASQIDERLAVLRWQLVGGGVIVVVLGFVIGWFLVGRSLEPINSVTRTAAGISQGDLSQRIDASDMDSELGQMVAVLNETFAKLESSFDQQVRFTADASHELRTPISVILAKCQFALMRERSPEKYREALKTCEASAQHVRRLVESLLELARMDSGEFRVIRSPGDLAAVAESCVQLLSALAEEKQIELDVDLQPARVDMDFDRMHQVGINLISNAIKYVNAGGYVYVRTYSEPGAAVFEVRDTGMGIRREKLPHLFDRFYRVSKERSDEQNSTGLGLAITKAIVDAHGAEIDVVSEWGNGSTFTIRFPL